MHVIGFVVGQAIIAVGISLLYRVFGVHVAVGVACVVEGAICVVAALSGDASEPSRPWHAGAEGADRS